MIICPSQLATLLGTNVARIIGAGAESSDVELTVMSAAGRLDLAAPLVCGLPQAVKIAAIAANVINRSFTYSS